MWKNYNVALDVSLKLQHGGNVCQDFEGLDSVMALSNQLQSQQTNCQIEKVKIESWRS